MPPGASQNKTGRPQGITISQLMGELKARISLPERSYLRMIGQLDRKSQSKVTWNEFLNFLTNEGSRRETVNDAILYGYGVKRLK